jgi:ribosome-binding protein aMBF1 (putative translation factor)
MAKYSTGSGGGGSGDSCELCGAAGVDTQSVNVAGAQLEVCSDCAEHDDNASPADSGGDDEDVNRKKRAAQNTAKMHDAAKGDSSHWEDGADYEDDRLPYLVSDYDDRVTEARQEAGYQLEELAEELGIDDGNLLAVEQGRAAQAGVGGSVVKTVEEFLDVELVEAE